MLDSISETSDLQGLQRMGQNNLSRFKAILLRMIPLFIQ